MARRRREEARHREEGEEQEAGEHEQGGAEVDRQVAPQQVVPGPRQPDDHRASFWS